MHDSMNHDRPAIPASQLADQIRSSVEQVIVGRTREIELILTALFAGGHVLLEDVPGTGKTKLARSLARSVDSEFRRIQFTPDLLPSDLTGLHIYDQSQNDFVFRPGPIFTQFLLADEINRASPRTQSSLLECMEERQVTIDGRTMMLKEPFFVIATQNPVETAGTYPLPEAQLDRFFLQLPTGYPTTEQSRLILQRFLIDDPLTDLTPVCQASDLLAARQEIRRVTIHADLLDYLLQLVEATRVHEMIALGASPRAMLALSLGARALAAIRGRGYVIPDDIRDLAVPVLAHRMILRGSARSRTASSQELISSILEQVRVPTEQWNSGS